MCMPFEFPFSFTDSDQELITGKLVLEKPLPESEGIIHRPGRLVLDSGQTIDLTLTHSDETASFMYLSNRPVSQDFLFILGLADDQDFKNVQTLTFPGQLVLGAERTRLVSRCVKDLVSAPFIDELLREFPRDSLVTIPVLREGVKYQIAEALFDKYGYYCDEVIADSHHVIDESVSAYHRSAELSIFKDDDISEDRRQRITTAFVGDSIASGTVIICLFNKIRERFEKVKRIELIAPFATIRGLARMAHYSPPELKTRVHVFETVLNALPPDYYYSAHYPQPEFHIRPDLQKEYEDWWGIDGQGNTIADTVCAGYGWSEAFFAPRRQIEMINDELTRRHNLTIVDILKRKIKV